MTILLTIASIVAMGYTCNITLLFLLYYRDVKIARIGGMK